MGNYQSSSTNPSPYMQSYPFAQPPQPPQPYSFQPPQPQPVYLVPASNAPQQYAYVSSPQVPYGGQQMITVVEQSQRAEQAPLLSQKEQLRGRILAVACLILYVVSWISMISSVASIAISLHMVKKRFVVKKKPEVLAFSILELIAFAFVLSFSWFTETHCYTYYNGYNYWYTECNYEWLGWISFVIWGAFNLAFGVPRTVFCWRHDKEFPVSSSSPAPNQVYVQVAPAQANYSSSVAGSV